MKLGAQTSVSALLALLAPERMVLVGPAGPTLRAALQWASANPGTKIRRERDAGGTLAHELLITEESSGLISAEIGAIATLVPDREIGSALIAAGWELVASTSEGCALMTRGAGAHSSWVLPSPDVERERPLKAQRAPDISIIVALCDGAQDLSRSLLSLARHTTWPSELLLIDDACGDPTLAALLDQAAGMTGVRVLRNAVTVGPAATINRGLQAAAGDVVVLACGAQVGPRWLEHLVAAGRDGNRIATVAPVVDVESPIVAALGVDAVARLLAQRPIASGTAPQRGGACLFIRRAALDELGDLDAASGDSGLGEFSRRAGRGGWSHQVDGRTFVLAGGPRAVLDHREPAAGWWAHFLDTADEGGPPRPRVAFVTGSVDRAELELIQALESEWEPYVFSCDRRALRLSRMVEGELTTIDEWQLDPVLGIAEVSHREYRAIFSRVLREREIELVHILRLAGHTFDGPHVAARHGVPIVVSFADRHLVSGHAADRDDGEPGPWRDQVEAMLREADVFVTGSEHARELHISALPTLSDRPFELIEPGRRLRQRARIAAPPAAGGPVRILVAGGDLAGGGPAYLRAMRAADAEGRLEFHLLGPVAGGARGLGVPHALAEGQELADLATAIAPAFAGCLSGRDGIETGWLAEAWSLGLPVLATDAGAAAERIRAHGGGELLPADDPASGLRQICALADDAHAYDRLRDQATLHGTATIADARDAHAALYRRVIDRRRAFATRAAGPGPAHLRHGIVRMVGIVPGAHGVHPGSTYVRIAQRYRHPAVSWKVSLALRYADQDPLGLPADAVLVQRTALPPEDVEAFLAELERRQLPLLLDLDDHLLIKGAADPDYGRHQAGLAALMAAAGIVLVSTARLARALEGRARRIAIVPNLLDERLFLAGVRGRPVSEARTGPLQIVYIGSPTHARDLAMLRPVMVALADSHPGQFELNVIGVEPPGPDQEWYRRIAVPDRCKPYPEFVRWLRSLRPRWDVAVAPLSDDEFNSYKSDLKYLEYAALGLPAIFSDRAPYTSVGHRRTGLVVPDGVQPWAQALITLREDGGVGAGLADAAFEEVVSSRLMGHGADRLLALICAI